MAILRETVDALATSWLKESDAVERQRIDRQVFQETGKTVQEILIEKQNTSASIGSRTTSTATTTERFNLDNSVLDTGLRPPQPPPPPPAIREFRDPCANATYRLGKIKELSSKGTSDQFVGVNFANITKQCILIAEIYKCCADGETKLGWIELARSKSSRFYRDCGNGGKQAIVEQYYDLSELGPGPNLILDTLDTAFQSNTVSLSSKENLGWYNKKWANSCGAPTAANPNGTSVRAFDSFQEYFDSTYPTGIIVGESDTRSILNSKPIYAEASSPSTIIARAIKASCEGFGECLNEKSTVEPDAPVFPPVPEGPTFGEEEEIQGSRKLTTKERIQVEGGSTGVSQPHPNKPCRLATVSVFDEYQLGEYQLGIPVFATKDKIRPPLRYDSIRTVETRVFVGRVVEYIDIGRNPDCPYREHVVEYEEDDPSDKCFGIVKKDVTRIYEDGYTELYLQGAFVRYYRKQDADCAPETVKVYHPLDLGKDVINAKIRAKTKGLFDGSQTLECHHTSSTQPTASKTHYYEVTDCDSCGKTPYFAVAYGHNGGSGSTWAEGELNDTPTRAIYGQYRLMALEMPETQFTFYTNGQPTSSKDFYVINFSRTGMSDRVDPGNWELDLAELRGGSYANNVFTGSNVAVSSSNKVLTFIDDSDDRSDTISCTHDPYVSYDIISGSLTYGAYATSSRHTYGIVYPNLGIMILDPYKLNTELGFNTVTGSNVAGDNAFKLFTSISGSGVIGSYMKARNLNYKTTNHYFVRVGAPLANYSNNPTYVSGSEGQFFHPCFDTNPQTYITSVGLYNDFNELLAIAKLSKPINKSYDNDVLIKIRLNW
jgi:hypothetical protein